VPITITEYGDLACPTCAHFARSTERGIIAALVRTGKARLVYRGFETASATANHHGYVLTEVAAGSAGLQHLEWNFVLLASLAQPTLINGVPAEYTHYVTHAYLAELASQIPGLNIRQWRSHLADRALIRQVATDKRAALAAGVPGDPTLLVTGPKGTLRDPEVIPTVAKLRQLINRVS
jgi:predicted DsbA family dithiol-disulfide isomerase